MIDQITGSILIGGKSSRMGGGVKCLNFFNNKKIIDRVIERSKYQVPNLIINSNIKINELALYNLPIFPDNLKGYLGPLAGIHASLCWVKANKPSHNWIITFAGDTPFFPNNIVNKLYEEALKKNKKIVLAKSFGREHPVFGIWHISLEEDLKFSIKNKKIRKIDEWASKYSYSSVNFDNKYYDPFFNINLKEDLIEAEKIENQFFEK